MSEHILAVTTTGDERSAAALAKALLERRLVACVNIIPQIRSLYRWKDVVEDETESVLLMKTRADCYEKLAAALGELHSYDVPELIVLPIEQGSAAYFRWIDENVTSGP